MASIVRIPFSQRIPCRVWRIVATVDAADQIPDRLPAKGVVVVGTLNKPKWIAFDCPCKTGHRIMVTLDPSHWPHWVIRRTKKLSLSPSIDFCEGNKRCHFFLINGKINWI